MLRLEIDGRWEPEDFIEVLKGIESLYYKAVVRRAYPFEPPFFWFERSSIALSFDEHVDLSNDWLLARARSTARSYSRLRVARIEYASPGGIDLVGLGEACKAIEGIIDRLIKFFTERHLRRERDKQETIETAIKETELEKEQESLRALKIENARSILALRREYPEMPDDLFIALAVRDQDRLIPRITERKLVAATTSDGESSEDA
jgi:hypothetical protein